MTDGVAYIILVEICHFVKQVVILSYVNIFFMWQGRQPNNRIAW